eukprot:1048267_1
MAQQVNTGDEGETDFKFDTWIRQHNLGNFRDLLVKHNMTSSETLNTNSAEFIKLMTDPAFLAIGQTAKVLAALQQVPALQHVPAAHERVKVVRIFVSKEEEDATERLQEYRKQIVRLKSEIRESSDLLSKNVKECHQNIQTSFDQLLQAIEAKKQQIEAKLKSIEQEKRSQIQTKSQVIATEEEKVNKAKDKCTELQQDSAMDRQKRKHAIVSLVNDVMSNKVSPDAAKVNAQIVFECDVDNILSFDGLVHIYAPEQHPTPIIDDIECKAITDTTANIHFSAKLRNEDKERKILSDLFIKLEAAEEKEAQPDTEAIKFDKNQEKYEFKVKQLNKNSDYAMYIKLFETESNNELKPMNIDPLIVEFKTLDTQKEQKVFVYESDFDVNGICYAIGSNYGQKQFTNPHTQGLITVKSSKWHPSYHPVEQILGRVEQPFYCYSDNIQNSWFSVDFGANVKIKPTHYTLRHGTGNSHYLRMWNFEGSNNGNNWNGGDWNILKRHENDTSLNTAFGTQTWTVQCNESYQMFRIYMVGKNTDNDWTLMCSGFEIYGDLFVR